VSWYALPEWFNTLAWASVLANLWWFHRRISKLERKPGSAAAEATKLRISTTLQPRIKVPGDYRYAGMGTTEMGSILRDPRGSVEFADEKPRP
jgi:hypothetical protein